MEYITIIPILAVISLLLYLIWRYKSQVHTPTPEEVIADKLLEKEHKLKSEYVILEHNGHKIRMTKWEELNVWPFLSAQQKRDACKPVKPKDRVKITLEDGTEAYTNRHGSSVLAKEVKKQNKAK